MSTDKKIEQAEQFANELLKTVSKSMGEIAGIAIEDRADYEEVCNLLFENAEWKATADERHEEFIAKEKAFISAVNEAFNPLDAACKSHSEDLKARVREFAMKCETRYNAMLAKAAKLAKSDPKKARELNAQAEAELAPKIKGIAFVARMDAKVIDVKKLPKKFFKLVIDEAQLKAAAEAGEEVPGVVFNDVRTVRVTPSQRVFEKESK